MDIRKLIGQRIAKIRTNQGLLQADLAELTGFPISYISKVERGLISVGIFNLQKMTRALKISMIDLFKGC